MAELHHFSVVFSDDAAKHDPELHCTMCSEHLCDVQHGDTLDVLVSVADNHVCKLMHLLRTRGGTECGVDGSSHADIEHVTCKECIALHDSVVIRDSQR